MCVNTHTQRSYMFKQTWTNQDLDTLDTQEPHPCPYVASVLGKCTFGFVYIVEKKHRPSMFAHKDTKTDKQSAQINTHPPHTLTHRCP